MRAITLALLFALLTASLVGVALAAKNGGGFTYGVAAGEITPTSAKLWTRAPKAGAVVVEVKQVGGGAATPRIGLDTIARPANDLTVSGTIPGLKPATRYTYRFRQGSTVSGIGSFRTAPTATTSVQVRFAISGDADATPAANGKPGFNNYETYGRMATERNDFNINLGDTIYSDSELSGSKPALTVPAKWQKYRYGLALPALQRLRSSAGLYSQPDDHEYVNDFSVPEFGKTLYRAGVKAFTDYAPVSWKPGSGFYRTFRWGQNLELFVLDERSFRSAKVAKQCADDLAPAAPAPVRAAFAALIPSLANPVPTGCLEALDDPSRTMLGASQETAFLKAIRASNATFKVVVNEVPIQQFYQLPYDRWEGYAAARTRLLESLAGVKNIVFLTTDTHANLFGEIRLQTLEGPPVGTGIWEAVTGPVATNTYAKEIDSAIGAKGTGDFVTSLFLKPVPPRGIGMACAATDVFSYSEVVVTASTLTVTPKTASGARVAEKTGAVCAPLVVAAR
jgi:alkaline phosphatase D